MTTLAWGCALSGVLLFAAAAGVIGADVWLRLTGRETISAWCLALGARSPLWPFLFGFALTVLAGGLVGHLHGDRTLPLLANAVPYAFAVAGGVLGLVTGVVLGWLFLAQ